MRSPAISRVQTSGTPGAAWAVLAGRFPIRLFSGAPAHVGSRKERFMSDSYYHKQHLADFARIAEGSPDLGKKFFDYYSAVFADGALSAREKSLIALAVAHAVQCPYCIDAYTQDCQQKGADFEQMTEALHVAVAIRGGASLVHGMQMRERARQQGM
jgi:4-carboxymuconolactone decarboxylase